MQTFLGFLFIFGIFVIYIAIKHVIRKGVSKADDAIRNSIDRKRGKMEESSSQSLAGRMQNGK